MTTVLLFNSKIKITKINPESIILCINISTIIINYVRMRTKRISNEVKKKKLLKTLLTSYYTF